MPQKYGLSEAEYELMEFIWNAGRPLTFGDIEDYLAENTDKNWKKQTLHTYLTRLVEKGTLKTASRIGRRHIYESAMSKEEYISHWTHSFLDDSFGGSLGNFMSALTGNAGKLSQKDIEELRRYLDE